MPLTQGWRQGVEDQYDHNELVLQGRNGVEGNVYYYITGLEAKAVLG